MKEGPLILTAGVLGALSVSLTLEWLSPDLVDSAVVSVVEISEEKPLVDFGLQQCELKRITVEAETASLEVRLAVLKASIGLAKPSRPVDFAIEWPTPLLSSGWPVRIRDRIGGWVGAIPNAHLHKLDCEEMPCLAAVSWEQNIKDQVDIAELVAANIDEDVGVAAPFGRLAEKKDDTFLWQLSVVAIYPIDMMTQWPARIDKRAALMIKGLGPIWVEERKTLPPAQEGIGGGDEAGHEEGGSDHGHAH
jgi:hypothetical protein